MNNKILILVNCPVLEKTYEIFVPVEKKIGTVINLIIKAINELSDENFPTNVNAWLYNKDTGEKYSKNVTIKEAGIVNEMEVIFL